MHLNEALEIYLLQLEADGRSIHTRLQAKRHVGSLHQGVDVLECLHFTGFRHANLSLLRS